MGLSNSRRVALALTLGVIAAAAVPALSASARGEITHASLVPDSVVSGDAVQIEWAWLGGSRVSSQSLINVYARSDGAWTKLAQRLPIRTGAVTWDTTGFEDGSYEVRLKVVGQSVTDTVSNIVVDNTAPQIVITRPTQSQIIVDDETPVSPVVAGTATLEATAFDFNGVETITWYLNDVEIGTGSPLTYDFSAEPGQHVLTATATDLVGHESSDSIQLIAVPGPNFLVDGGALPEPPEGEDPGEPGEPGLPDLGETPDPGLPDLGELPDPGLPDLGETPDPTQGLPDPNNPPALPDPGPLPTP